MFASMWHTKASSYLKVGEMGKTDLSSPPFLCTRVFSGLFPWIVAAPVSNDLTRVSLMLPLDRKLRKVPQSVVDSSFLVSASTFKRPLLCYFCS